MKQLLSTTLALVCLSLTGCEELGPIGSPIEDHRENSTGPSDGTTVRQEINCQQTAYVPGCGSLSTTFRVGPFDGAKSTYYDACGYTFTMAFDPNAPGKVFATITVIQTQRKFYDRAVSPGQRIELSLDNSGTFEMTCKIGSLELLKKSSKASRPSSEE